MEQNSQGAGSEVPTQETSGKKIIGWHLRATEGALVPGFPSSVITSPAEPNRNQTVKPHADTSTCWISLTL